MKYRVALHIKFLKESSGRHLKYIEKILGELLHDMEGTAKIPAANHLFTVSYDAKNPSVYEMITSVQIYIWAKGHDKTYRPSRILMHERKKSRYKPLQSTHLHDAIHQGK